MIHVLTYLIIIELLLIIPYTRRILVVIISILSDIEFFLIFDNNKEGWKENFDYIIHG